MTEQRVLDWLRARGADVVDAENLFKRRDGLLEDISNSQGVGSVIINMCRRDFIAEIDTGIRALLTVAAMESGVVSIVRDGYRKRKENERFVVRVKDGQVMYFGATTWLALVALVEAMESPQVPSLDCR